MIMFASLILDKKLDLKKFVTHPSRNNKNASFLGVIYKIKKAENLC